MRNNLIILLCHCNTPEKEEILKENILILKQSNHDILVVSHIPVNVEIQNLIDYFIYDKSNPIITFPIRGMVHWKYIEVAGQSIKLQNIAPDYGWTVINQIINASKLTLPLDYTHYSFINYDIEFTKEILHELREPADLVCSKVQDNEHPQGYRFPSLMINILSKHSLQRLIPNLLKDEYTCDTHMSVKNGKYRDVEQYWEHMVSIFDYLIIEKPIKDKANFEYPKLFNKSEHPEFKIFLQNNNTHRRIDTNSFTPRIVIYDNKAQGLTLNINDQEILIETDIVQNLPEITSIGYTYNNKYFDLTTAYTTETFTTINYA